jgi:rhodanese-related sulfurtransferase
MVLTVPMLSYLVKKENEPQLKRRSIFGSIETLIKRKKMAKKLTKEELKGMMDSDEDFLLVNVLPKENFDEEHIPKSLNIPVSSEGFEQQFVGAAPVKRIKIVVYCASFECHASPNAAKKLEESGYTNIYDYEGGMKDWKEAGYPVEGSK